MTKFKTVIVVTGLLSAAMFSAASAGSPADYFNKIDADANGAISKAEFVAYKTADGKSTTEQAETKFTKLAAGDDTITLAEFEAAMKAHDHRKAKDKADTSS